MSQPRSKLSTFRAVLAIFEALLSSSILYSSSNLTVSLQAELDVTICYLGNIYAHTRYPVIV